MITRPKKLSVIPTHKHCEECGEQKPMRQFYANPNYADGRLTRCRICHSARMRGYQAKKKSSQDEPLERAS